MRRLITRLQFRPEMSALDAGSAAFHQFLDFGKTGHGSVAGRGHGQSAVGCSVFNGDLRITSGHKAVNQPGGEAVAPANTIEDLEVFAVGRFVEFSASPANSPPIVDRG